MFNWLIISGYITYYLLNKIYNSWACANYTWHSEESKVRQTGAEWEGQRNTYVMWHIHYTYIWLRRMQRQWQVTHRDRCCETHSERHDTANTDEVEWMEVVRTCGPHKNRHMMGMLFMTRQPHRQLWTHQETVLQLYEFHQIQGLLNVDSLLPWVDGDAMGELYNELKLAEYCMYTSTPQTADHHYSKQPSQKAQM